MLVDHLDWVGASLFPKESGEGDYNFNNESIIDSLTDIAKESRETYRDVKDGEDLISKFKKTLKNWKGYPRPKNTLSHMVSILELNKEFSDNLATHIKDYIKHGGVKIIGINNADPYEDPELYEAEKQNFKQDQNKRDAWRTIKLKHPPAFKPDLDKKEEDDDYW